MSYLPYFPALFHFFLLRKSTLYSNTTPNSKYGLCPAKTTVQSNQIVQTMLQSGNTDWSFAFTNDKMPYVNFCQNVSFLKEKTCHFASLKRLLLLKWNWTRMNAKWIVMKTANTRQWFWKERQVFTIKQTFTDISSMTMDQQHEVIGALAERKLTI